MKKLIEDYKKATKAMAECCNDYVSKNGFGEIGYLELVEIVGEVIEATYSSGVVVGIPIKPHVTKGIYTHVKTGDCYEVIDFALNSQDEDQEIVVYMSIEDGKTWIRPAKDFLRNFK